MTSSHSKRFEKATFNKGRLPDERQQKLLDAGFVFDNLLETEWQKNYELYKAFKTEFGREPKTAETYEGVSLGTWCRTQKMAFKNGKLSEYRTQKLFDSGFVF